MFHAIGADSSILIGTLVSEFWCFLRHSPRLAIRAAIALLKPSGYSLTSPLFIDNRRKYCSLDETTVPITDVLLLLLLLKHNNICQCHNSSCFYSAPTYSVTRSHDPKCGHSTCFSKSCSYKRALMTRERTILRSHPVGFVCRLRQRQRCVFVVFTYVR